MWVAYHRIDRMTGNRVDPANLEWAAPQESDLAAALEAFKNTDTA